VANSKIELELCGRKLRLTLRFTIRHQYQIEDEPKSVRVVLNQIQAIKERFYPLEVPDTT
jgi:hypothetical protein